MRLWTIQPPKVLKLVNETGVYRCDPSMCDLLIEELKEECPQNRLFHNAYSWLHDQMVLRIGKPPMGVYYPVWAWHTFNNERKVDLRCSEFRSDHKGYLCLEIEIPETKVLLSNEDTWHSVMNHWYIEKPGLLGEEDNSKKEWTDAEIRESWTRIFDVLNPLYDQSYIQATFWELKKEQILSVKEIKWDSKPFSSW